jgi:glycosyltransferase involved in cell wall biosynthesis
MTAPRTLMLGHGWFPDQLGGLDRYYRDLLEHTPEAHGVVIGRGASTPARLAGVSAHSSPLPWRLLAFWRATQRMADAADVVDAHFALYSLLPLWLGKLRRKPVVVHFHGPWALESVSAGDGSRLKLRARLALERAAYRRADQLVVLTSAFRQVLVERYGVQPWIVNVEPPGVDLERFTPGSRELARDRLGLAQGAFIVAAVRRLVPRMGLELLLEVWKQLLAELPAGSTLVIAGDGPLRPQLASNAAHASPDSVRLLGRISDAQLVDLYRAADMAVLPTLAYEGFGLVVLEAAACGTPSIVSSVGGLPEAIGGLDPSLIVAPGDPAALRERLLSAVAERPGRERVRGYAERFHWDGVAARNREIAERAISRTPKSDQRLKVVYLDHVARMSGGEIALLRLLPHLDRVNAHVILAEDGPLVEQLHLAGISTEVLPFAESARDLRKADVRGGALPVSVAAATASYTLRLAARLRRLHPDLVHTNSLKAAVYGSIAARLAGVPVIWHARDRIAEDYLPRPAVLLIRRLTRRLPAAVVANSQSTMDTLSPPGSSPTIYRVIPDALGDVPVRERAVQPALTYGVVGRLAPWKGQDLFLRAFARAFPESEERAVLVGGALFGEGDYADELPRLAEQLGITDRVELRGHRNDVWAELARLDVLVHSSVTPEPFGQVILEGMAAGVPVIAAGSGGPAEILDHEVTGILYDQADEQRLAESMRLMSDPALRARLSAAARTAVRRYSPDAVADRFQHVYDEVVDRSRPC